MKNTPKISTGNILFFLFLMATINWTLAGNNDLPNTNVFNRISEKNENAFSLLIPKGWDGYFSYPVPFDVVSNPSEGIAVDRTTDRVYVTSGTTPGTVTVLGDNTESCLVPFAVDDGFGLAVFTVQD